MGDIPNLQDDEDRQRLLQVMVSKDNPHIEHVEADNSIVPAVVGVADSHLDDSVESDYCKSPERYLLAVCDVVSRAVRVPVVGDPVGGRLRLETKRAVVVVGSLVVDCCTVDCPVGTAVVGAGFDFDVDSVDRRKEVWSES